MHVPFLYAEWLGSANQAGFAFRAKILEKKNKQTNEATKQFTA